ncbi:hypothetical protein D3C81_1348320 [compost metagenome]
MVGQVQPAQFDVIFRGHGNFGVAVEIAFAHAKLRPAIAEYRFLVVCAALCRLIGRGPVCTAGDIAQVAEAAQCITGGVFAPTGDSQVVMVTVTTADMVDHDVVVAVGEQLHCRVPAVRLTENAQPGFAAWVCAVCRRCLEGMQIRRSGFRHALLKQQHAGLKLRVAGEAPLHGQVQQYCSQGKETHALVVRHERADDHSVLPGGQTRLAVVYRLVQSKPACDAQCAKPLQVFAGRGWRYHQRQRAGVGRNHALLAQAALEAQARHAERPVLVVEVSVQRVVGRL